MFQRCVETTLDSILLLNPYGQEMGNYLKAESIMIEKSTMQNLRVTTNTSGELASAVCLSLGA